MKYISYNLPGRGICFNMKAACGEDLTLISTQEDGFCATLTPFSSRQSFKNWHLIIPASTW